MQAIVLGTPYNAQELARMLQYSGARRNAAMAASRIDGGRSSLARKIAARMSQLSSVFGGGEIESTADSVAKGLLDRFGRRKVVDISPQVLHRLLPSQGARLLNVLDIHQQK